jgi:hypothetical protein
MNSTQPFNSQPLKNALKAFFAELNAPANYPSGWACMAKYGRICGSRYLWVSEGRPMRVMEFGRFYFTMNDGTDLNSKWVLVNDDF